ncbi:MAG: hypothetical protein LH472_12905 [Pyrinomonadaceae bacterium]|nr:hypothetical protein [Pyrinomonadaceae bacterium]
MIFRAIALSLAIIVGLGTIIPLATNGVEAGSQTKKRAKNKDKKYKKYSKRWWRAYRQRSKNRNSLNARKRSLRLRQIRLANARKLSETGGANQTKIAQSGKKLLVEDNSPAMLPSGEPAPTGWKRGTSSTGEIQYNVVSDNGSNLGSAAISVVGVAVGADNNKTVGGVAVTALRRTVIDRMMKEGGWVVNDYQKDVGDKKVYVVVAKSAGADGSIQSRLFYFTEADGRIYSVATNAPNDNSRRLEEESEKAIISLRHRTQPTQQAELK